MWKDMDSAPRNGTKFIARNDKGLAFRTFCLKHYVKWPHEEGGPTFREVWSAEDLNSTWPWSPTQWTEI